MSRTFRRTRSYQYRALEKTYRSYRWWHEDYGHSYVRRYERGDPRRACHYHQDGKHGSGYLNYIRRQNMRKVRMADRMAIELAIRTDHYEDILFSRKNLGFEHYWY